MIRYTVMKEQTKEKLLFDGTPRSDVHANPVDSGRSGRARAMKRSENLMLLSRNDMNDIRSSLDSINSANFRDKRVDLQVRHINKPSIKAGIEHEMESVRYDRQAFHELSARFIRDRETSLPNGTVGIGPGGAMNSGGRATRELFENSGQKRHKSAEDSQKSAGEANPFLSEDRQFNYSPSG